ncbi:hypothetical protein BC940DRAFT_312056 [Gongronella butleri]|nr:hypothetical protein BC940DRAFT_312056 [Gongronella butleri]
MDSTDSMDRTARIFLPSIDNMLPPSLKNKGKLFFSSDHQDDEDVYALSPTNEPGYRDQLSPHGSPEQVSVPRALTPPSPYPPSPPPPLRLASTPENDEPVPFSPPKADQAYQSLPQDHPSPSHLHPRLLQHPHDAIGQPYPRPSRHPHHHHQRSQSMDTHFHNHHHSHRLSPASPPSSHAQIGPAAPANASVMAAHHPPQSPQPENYHSPPLQANKSTTSPPMAAATTTQSSLSHHHPHHHHTPHHRRTISYPVSTSVSFVNPPPQRKYPCPQCNKTFSRPSSLRTHLFSHSGEKPYVCPHDGCGRRFSVQSNMRRHLRVHTLTR